MQLITDISRIVLPLITVILLVKCILALWLAILKKRFTDIFQICIRVKDTPLICGKPQSAGEIPAT